MSFLSTRDSLTKKLEENYIASKQKITKGTRQDKGEKFLEKHVPLLTSLSYVQKACEKY